ncbi:extracellular solute-binding protein [Paenibacillus sp. P25]|nr:extracellular solute-binding protein [Paenibacillus sp. P25]
MMKRTKQKRTAALLSAALLGTALTGCTFTMSAPKAQPVSGKVSVMYYDEGSFLHEYGDLLYSKFPELELEVVSTQGIYGPDKDPNKELAKLLDEKKPDIVMVGGLDSYEKLAQAGKLQELDPYIQKDGFDVQNMLPGVIDLLKARGQGKLYGLAPQFQSQALFYNKDLFDQYGVPYPKDQMSWKEVFELAARFPSSGTGDNRIYGYTSMWNSPSGMLMTVGGTENLSYVDTTGKTVIIGSEPWRKVFELVVNSYKQGVLPPKFEEPANRFYGPDDMKKRDLFGSGRAAMTLDGTYLIERLKQEESKVNWALVTAPVDPGKQGIDERLLHHEYLRD